MTGAVALNANIAPSGHGNFFAIDRRAFAFVANLGHNPMVAYLVLARGSQRDNRTTSWSRNALEIHTGLSRGRSQRAISDLLQAGALTLLRSGTRPAYYIVPAHEIRGCEGFPPEKPDGPKEEEALRLIREGKELGWIDYQTAQILAKKQLIRHDLGPRLIYEIVSYDPEAAAKPDWIWLPNELVEGVSTETPPLALLRQRQDPYVLRLFIDSYHSQNLREEVGIRRGVLRTAFERFKVGENAQFVIWGFRKALDGVFWEGFALPHFRHLTKKEQAEGMNSGCDFFNRFDALKELGLVEWTAHLTEGPDDGAEFIHPFGIGASNSPEDQLGRLAHEAGWSMLTEAEREAAAAAQVRLVPVLRHLANVQVVGIYRLRYRPHTKLTSAWWADQQLKMEHNRRIYESLLFTMS